MRNNTCLIILLIVLVVGPVPASHALTPQGRHLTGTIQQADAKNCRAVLLTTDKPQSISFIWNKRTDFVAGTKLVPASKLITGTQIEIILHRPLFGEPFVTKVIFLNLETKH